MITAAIISIPPTTIGTIIAIFRSSGMPSASSLGISLYYIAYLRSIPGSLIDVSINAMTLKVLSRPMSYCKALSDNWLY